MFETVVYSFCVAFQAYQGRATTALKGVAEEAAAVHEGVVESVKSAYGTVARE